MADLIVAPAEGFDSYVSLDEANAYMSSVGYDTEWTTLSDEVKQAYIRRGAQYIGAQRLIAEAIDPVVVPNVKAAACEAAIRAKRGVLYKDVPQQAVKSVTIGPIKRDLSEPATYQRFSIIDDLLYGWTVQGFNMGPVVLERA